MVKIKCTKCGNEVELNENQFSEILSHVKEEEIDRRVKIRESEIKKAADLEAKQNHEKEIGEFKLKIEKLNNDIKNKDLEKDKELEVLVSKHKCEILNLENKIKNKDTESESILNKKTGEYEKQITELNAKLNEAKLHEKLSINEALKVENEKHYKIEEELKSQLEHYKNFRSGLSVKLIGEALEKYCEDEFNKIRTVCYPNCYFKKDSDIKINGEKGDYIFKDYITDDSGENIELVSIMFDMKTEQDVSATKKKNEDFFKKLDSDRNAKNCTYAVLVSTLEADSNLYGGITDVSYKYPNMYVVRPQCFLSIISIIRNLALKNANAKKELVTYKKQNFDVEQFENEWEEWKKKFNDNINKSYAHFDKAINFLDETIKKLTKAREELEGTKNQLGYADKKVNELTLKKLAKNSPSIKEKLK